MTRTARICSVCVMDESLVPLEFDAKGQCACCRTALTRLQHEYFPNEEGRRRIDALVAKLRAEGRGRPYDCMVGLSGGIDSAYLAHVLKAEHGLRLLAIHVDGGWNTEVAVANIERVVRGLDIDLVTEVIEWEEMRDLQVAFLRAGVLNQDIPQDHAFFATLYRTAREFGIKTYLSGVNFATESVGAPGGGGHFSMDGTHLQDIHRRFGRVPLRRYPVMTFAEYLVLTRLTGRLRIFKPLDWMNYDKSAAHDVLAQAYGWRDYGKKHSESRFTKFYQDIYLPAKTGFDKRRLHLSSLIVSGQITRDQAMAELETPLIDPRQARFELRFVAKKLGLDSDEMDALIRAPLIPHTTYGNDLLLYRMAHLIRDLTLLIVLCIRQFSHIYQK